MYYFGYCTYLSEVEMRKYLPDAKVAAKGYMQNALISFCAIGANGHRGRCHLDLTPNAWGERTYGLVLEHDEKYFVDYPDFIRIPVTIYGEDGKMYDCWTYIMEDPGKATKPADEYWGFVANGLKECGFSDEYSQKVTEIYNECEACTE